MELFWTRGYEATSVADLTGELGVHPGSLYRAFGDKHALFLRALARYRETQARPLAPALLAGGPVLPRIRADVEDGFLQGLRAAARQGEIADTLDLRGWAATLTVNTNEITPATVAIAPGHLTVIEARLAIVILELLQRLTVVCSTARVRRRRRGLP